MKILIVKLSAAGDVILITASLRAIRQRFPKARIECLVGASFTELLEACPYLDQIIPCPKKTWLAAFKMGFALRKKKFDILIDFQHNKKSHVMGFLSRAKKRYGFNRKLGFLLTDAEPDTHYDLAAVPHQFQILRHLGIKYDSKQRLELWPSSADKKNATNLLQAVQGQKIIAISICASNKWATKSWPAEYIIALCNKLADINLQVVLTGINEDLALAESISLKCNVKPVNCVGKTTLTSLASVIGKSHVFLGPDSAALHIAAAMRTPFVALFGPTDAKRHIPPYEKGIVLQKKLSCGPCYQQHCPIKTHECMRSLTVEQVFEAILSLLG